MEHDKRVRGHGTGLWGDGRGFGAVGRGRGRGVGVGCAAREPGDVDVAPGGVAAEPGSPLPHSLSMSGHVTGSHGHHPRPRLHS